MKFVATQSAILRSLMLVFGGSSKAGESSMVKIIANKEINLITLEAKNIDIKIKSFFKSEITTSGEIFVELVKLTEVIKKLNNETEISLETKDLTLFIKSGKSKFSLKGVESAVPSSDAIGEDKGSFKIMSKKILSLIDKTKFSVYPDETRFNLNGILLQFKNIDDKSFLTAVSTDGHRLSFCHLEVDAPKGNSFPKIIIPKKSTAELRKILDTIEDEEVELKLLEKQLVLSSNSFYFTSKLIDAEFPEYEKVIPQENTKISIVNRKDFITLIERVSAIHAGSSENNIKLTFSNNLVNIFGKNKDSGEANDEVQAEANFEELISVNYNYVYLLEILSHISSEKVLICLKDERTPALIKDEKLDSYFYILMPMRF